MGTGERFEVSHSNSVILGNTPIFYLNSMGMVPADPITVQYGESVQARDGRRIGLQRPGQRRILALGAADPDLLLQNPSGRCWNWPRP